MKKHFFNKNTWIKGVYLLICAWIFTCLSSVILLTSALQFIFLISIGEVPSSIKELSYSIHKYTNDLLAFLTFQNNRPPFPFS